jgi:lipid II isoglutaminyl synthase (glutamine-hydrolysing)
VLNTLLTILGKSVVFFSKIFNLGNGSTWPGHIALILNPNFIKQILKQNNIEIILIAGTNGKTTTGKLIQTVLEKNNKKVFQNAAGANLVNGIASTLILNSNLNGKIDKDFAVLEIDENTLPVILKEITNPDLIIILNLFRDQLDRYGEVNTIAAKWSEALSKLNNKTALILNADDPQVAYLASNFKGAVEYFGIDPKNTTDKIQHASDSTYCPKCNEKLIYKSAYFSHLGDWICNKCKYKHSEKIFTSSPFYPLPGVYNEYNTNAAVLLIKKLGFDEKTVATSLKNFKPAFGRQEILDIDGKKVQIFLSKNPTSFNESLKTIAGLKAQNLLIALNDRIPDGRDVSWIWDIDLEYFSCTFKNVFVSGDRTFDMGLRLKYAQFNQYKTEANLTTAMATALSETPVSETLYILPTYSAMLELRRVLTGKKIL